jgi:IS30 family transposase
MRGWETDWGSGGNRIPTFAGCHETRLAGSVTPWRADDSDRLVVAGAPASVPEARTRKVSTLTHDQGREMAGHAGLVAATGMRIFFADPHAPWQRGASENTNGLLRQYFPKGAPLSAFDQADLDTVADSLNARPRKTLELATPAKQFKGLLAGLAGERMTAS